MRNFIQPGDTMTLVAPYAVTSGGGILVGALFGVALNAAANGASVEVKMSGVFDLPKATGEAWTAGQRVYWDNTNRRLTTTVGTNTLVGAAARAQAAADTTGRAKITDQV